MPRKLSGLWQHPEFLKLWAGQTISLIGSQVTVLALPLTAVLALEASPIEMGALIALQRAPGPLVSLFAGAWVDRLRRKPILIATDMGQAVLLGSIPIAAWLGVLRIEQLYLVAFLTGILTVVFGVAYVSFLPSVTRREDLLEANSKLETSRSMARIAGPGVGGILVQLFSAPIAILTDAASFLISAAFLGRMRVSEPAPTSQAKRRNIWAEINEGGRVVLTDRVLLPLAGFAGSFNLFGQLMEPLYFLYVTQELGIAPATLGVVFAIFGPGALLGALLARPAMRRYGLGPMLVGAGLAAGIGNSLIPLASGSQLVTVPLLASAQFLIGLANTAFAIGSVTLRQVVTPDRLLGRVDATNRFISGLALLLGGVAGGVLGDALGVRAALAVGALGSLVAVLWLVVSPVRATREIPAAHQPLTTGR